MDVQLQYKQIQSSANVGWILKYHHFDLLEDIYAVIKPVNSSVPHLQEEIQATANSTLPC